MPEPANMGVTSDTDVTIDGVSEELVDKVQAGLDALNDDPRAKPDKGEKQILAAVSGTESVVSAAESAISAAESVVSATESSVSAADSVTGAAAVADEKNYDIEDNLYRAAVHQGWDDKQIKEFMQLDPDRARATFQKMYETTNKLSNDWAAKGRVQLEQGADRQQQQQGVKSKTDDKSRTEFKGIDIDKLRKDYDNDPVVELVAGQQEQNKVLFDMVQDLQEVISTRQDAAPQGQQAGVSAEAAAVVQQVDAFFKQDDMKSYDDFYGSGDNLTPGQMANRNAAFELADQIRAGRALQGLDTTVEEALIQAHLLVSEPVREKMVRTNIVSKLQKRSKSLSLKPGSAGRDVNATERNKPQTPQEIEDNARLRLSKMKW